MLHKFNPESNDVKTTVIVWPKKLIYFILAVLAVGLITLQLVFSNNLASEGAKLFHLSLTERRLVDENLRLKMEIAKEGSLTAVSEKAAVLNMAKASRYLYISRSTPLALGQN